VTDLSSFDRTLHLRNHQWLIKQKPFPYFTAENIFTEEVYDYLCEGFKQHEVTFQPQAKLTRYDAEIRSISPRAAPFFFPLFDQGWLSLIGDAFAVKPSFEVDAATHIHPPRSRAGWIHNDYNPGWFEREAANEVVFSQEGGCDYKRDYSASAGSFVPRVRYITIIYYLLNDNWVPADAGETGIYSCRRQPVDRPDVKVSPLNNSILAFECTPHSFHSFMGSNTRRNSITLWLHRPMEEARKEWPSHEPVRWR
jgi:hypothetical protein